MHATSRRLVLPSSSPNSARVRLKSARRQWHGRYRFFSIYWYFIVPCLLVMVMWSLTEIIDILRVDQITRERKVRPSRSKFAKQFFPHNEADFLALPSTSSSFGENDTQIVHYRSTPEKKIKPGLFFSSSQVSKPHQHNVSEFNDSAHSESNFPPQKPLSANWWQDLRKTNANTPRANYPQFVHKLKFIQTQLEKAAQSQQQPKNEVNSTRPIQAPAFAWKPAASPINQSIPFREPFLTAPSILTSKSIDSDKPVTLTPQVAVLVLSDQKNFLRRQAIRETWARMSSKRQVYFVIGHSNCNDKIGNYGSLQEYDDGPLMPIIDGALQEDKGKQAKLGARRRRLLAETTTRNITYLPKLTPLSQMSDLGSNQTGEKKMEKNDCEHRDRAFLFEEQTRYRDLIEIPMTESYSRLPEKLLQAYKWALEFLPSTIQWLVKADDDTFVRVESLENYLRKYNSNIPMLIGKIIPCSRVKRDGKWAEREFFESDWYPYWAQGSAGHVVSRSAAHFLVNHSSDLHRYQGEDVSLGIWLNHANELDTDIRSGGGVTYIQAQSMITNDGTSNCGENKYMMIGHDLTLDDMYDCYRKFGNMTFHENAWLDDRAEFQEKVAEELASWNDPTFWGDAFRTAALADSSQNQGIGASGDKESKGEGYTSSFWKSLHENKPYGSGELPDHIRSHIAKRQGESKGSEVLLPKES